MTVDRVVLDRRMWRLNTRLVDAARRGQFGVFDRNLRQLYRVRRSMAYCSMYTHLALGLAIHEWCGSTPTVDQLRGLAAELQPEWAPFRMPGPDHEQLVVVLVSAAISLRQALEVGEAPRLEHQIVAFALVLRRLEQKPDQYLARVEAILQRNPLPADFGSA